MRKIAKEVTVLYVYRFKHVARICFEVLSSDGETHYNTCFSHDAEHGVCNCPSRRGCYHIDQLKSQAQAYFESRKKQHEVAAQPAATIGSAMSDADTALRIFEREQDAALDAAYETRGREITNPARYQIVVRNGRYVPQRCYADDPAWRDLPAVFHGASVYEARMAVKTHFGVEDAPIVGEPVSVPAIEHATCDFCGGHHNSSTCYL